MDRIELFKKWLERLTPEKIEMLIRLEKAGRLYTHVYELNQNNDEKILASIRQVSHELRREYSRVSVDSLVKDVNKTE